jgi:hypothetical protein
LPQAPAHFFFSHFSPFGTGIEENEMGHAQSLIGDMIARSARRADHRSEERHEDVFDSGTIALRGRDHVVPIVNISVHGAMLETGLKLRVGEVITLRLDGCSPIKSMVCWVRDGRVGINFGTELALD